MRHNISPLFSCMLVLLAACDPADDELERDAMLELDEVEPSDGEALRERPPLPRALLADASAEDAEVGWIRGELIDQIELAEDHVVQFWEVEPGVVLTYEIVPADPEGESRSRLSDLPEGGLPLLEMYLHVRPELDEDEIPPVVLEAAAREQDHRISAEALTTVPELPDGSPTASTVGDGAIDQLTAKPDVQAVCSPDYYGDAWGQQWFLNNYCNFGIYRWCPTNVTWAHTGHEPSNGYRVSGMAADFWNGANFAGSHFNGLFWQADYNMQILPRYVQTFTYWGWGMRQAEIVGHVGCQRVHLAKGFSL